MKTYYSFLILLFLQSCSPADTKAKAPSSQEIKSSNEIRKKIGLREIQSSWVFYRSEFNAEDWKMPSTQNIGKRVQFTTDHVPIWEEDYFYSGNTYKDDEGTAFEHITFHYDYTSHHVTVYYFGLNRKVRDLFGIAGTDVNNVSEATTKLKQALDELGIKY